MRSRNSFKHNRNLSIGGAAYSVHALLLNPSGYVNDRKIAPAAVVAEVDEYNRERLQSHHFAPQQCKDFYKNVEVDPKFRDCPLRTGVPMWREFETCLNR